MLKLIYCPLLQKKIKAQKDIVKNTISKLKIFYRLYKTVL